MSLSANNFYYTNTNHNDASNVLINYDNLTGNSELIQHPLNKYARELFFSPTYNTIFFNSINWANSLGKYKNQNNLINPLVDNVLMNIDILDDTISGKSIISHIVKMGHINGELAGDNIGWSISSNEDGTIVAIGAYNHAPGGVVRVYEWNGSIWEKMGSDIEAETSGDLFGMSVALSANGKIFASGGYSNAGSGPAAGHARVYEWNGTTWVQMGSDIDAEAPGDRSGITISLSADGKIVAVGARENDGTTNNTNDNRGHVRVYKWNNSSWQQIGDDIDGEAAGDQSAGSYYSNNVSLNANGTIVAIGAMFNDGGGQDSGHVRVYQYTNNTWLQMGSDIDGEVKDDWFGNSVSLSADGTILATGAPRHDTAGDRAGRVYVYKYNGNDWEIIGTFDGEAAYDQYGMCVSLNNDGTILAIGGPHNRSKGHVRIYQYIKGLYASEWIKIGNDIEGEGTSDEFGHAVSLSKDGSVLVVSAVYDDNTGTNAGSVYTYELVKQPITSIVEMGTPISGQPYQNSQFGFSVSSNADGTVIAIGSILMDDPLFDSGGVYIYKWEGNNWNNIGYIGGDNYYDLFGNSVSLNGDGTRVAIGSKANQGVGGPLSGHVRVHEWNGSTWDQMGADIDGEATNDNSGHSVSLSDDGSIVAIAAPQHDGGKGHVRVYKWDGSSWQQRGNDIDGEAAGDESGQSISLSADGTIVAIGSHKNNSSRGHVRVHKWDGSSWQQIGDDIDGEGGGDESGWSISLNGDGTIVAIGAIKNDGINGADSGHVRVYDYVEGRNPEWKQMGSDIDGESSSHYGDWSGFSVSLSGDGTIVAIGARLNDVDPATDSNIGSARVYQYVKGLYASEWVQIGDDIDGEASGDHFGYSISLSKNGSTLVIATPFNSGGGGSNAGKAYMYKLIKQSSIKSIVKMGEPFNGESANELFGYNVSSNVDGSIIAISSLYNDGDTNNTSDNRGSIRVYQYYKNRNNTLSEFPPVMDANETTINNMTFKASASSTASDVYASPWHAFDDNTNNTYHEPVYYPTAPYNTNGTYVGNYSTAGYDGEWLQIELPYKIMLHKFKLSNRNGISQRMPRTGVILGLNGNTWELIYTINETNIYESSETRMFDVTCYKLYNTFRLVTTNLFTSVGGSASANIGQWRLIGVNESDVLYHQMGNDIDGEYSGGTLGNSISLNDDGTIIGFGAHLANANGQYSGYASVHKYNDTTKIWDKMGDNIIAEGGDKLGWSTAISADGKIFAVSAKSHDNSKGVVRIYDYDENRVPAWEQLGDDIDGEADSDENGYSISLSSDGSIIAIGARLHNGNSTDSGYVRIYNYDKNRNPKWQQIGSNIDGINQFDYFGHSVSLNVDGTIIAIGAGLGNGINNTPDDCGYVSVYQNINNNWEQMGSTIYGKIVNEYFGHSVSLSNDGNILAIGGYYNTDKAGAGYIGVVRVYKYVSGIYSNDWVQIGNTIYGNEVQSYFGWSVSLSKNGSILLVGAPYTDSNGADSGSVYTYEIVDTSNIVETNISSTQSTPTESLSVTFDGDILGNVDSNTVLYQPKGQVWESTNIGPYRYNKFLLDVHIPGNYVASTWIGATLSDGNVVETVMNERTRVWMIIIKGQESQVDLVDWNLVNDNKYFLFRDTANKDNKYPYITSLYNRIFEAGTTYLDNSIALFVFENIDDTVV